MFIKINDISLFYEKSGTGSPIILLHGNGEDSHIFDKLTAKLQNDFTIYAIDSRNHGKSEQTDDYSYETMAEDVYSFIEALRLGPVDLIGFSDGAIISLILTMTHHSAVRKMALLGVNLSPDDFTEESLQYLNETYAETKDPLFKLMLEQPHIELDTLKDIETPTLLICGEHDIYKPETFTNIADALPHAILKIMEGHEHDSYIVDQDMLYPDFIHFFQEKQP